MTTGISPTLLRFRHAQIKLNPEPNICLGKKMKELEDKNGSAVNHQAQNRGWNQKGEKLKNRQVMDRCSGIDGGWRMDTGEVGGKGGRGIPDVSLLLLGEFHSVAEDLDSRLFKTESTCLGRLTVDTEHLPKKPRERHSFSHR